MRPPQVGDIMRIRDEEYIYKHYASSNGHGVTFGMLPSMHGQLVEVVHIGIYQMRYDDRKGYIPCECKFLNSTYDVCMGMSWVFPSDC